MFWALWLGWMLNTRQQRRLLSGLRKTPRSIVVFRKNALTWAYIENKNLKTEPCCFAVGNFLKLGVYRKYEFSQTRRIIGQRVTRANRLLEQEIKKAQPCARPICKKLVEIVYRGDPALEVTTKWGKPTFIKRGMICAIWPFLRHVSFVFPNGAGMSDSKKLFN